MSLALVDELGAATAQLRGAMQQADLHAVEKAMARFRAATHAVQALGAGRPDPALKTRIKEIIGDLESSRMLACLLGDMAGQMHTAQAARNPDAPQSLYGPR